MSPSDRKNALQRQLTEVRDRTLWLLSQVPDEFLRQRIHDFYSPIGWHFGHVGRTEEFWVVGEAARKPLLDNRLSFLFADVPGNPKDNRVHIPNREETIGYLAATRERVLSVLENADLDSEDPFLKDGYAWEFAIQHEYQHHETIAEMLQLIQKRRPVGVGVGGDQPWTRGVKSEFVDVPAGQFLMGTNVASAYDNEKVARTVDVEKFRLSRTAVTAREWTIFIEDGGYARRELWSEDGWSWKESECAVAPEYWLSRENRWLYFGPRGLRAIHPDEPASCLSWHEANAYANWAGKRLPTEIEWEYAASLGEDPGLAGNPGACHGLTNWGPRPVGLGKPSAIGIFDMAGNVWEWTSSPFLPYPGFVAFPYDGYSKDHMLGAHRVCRGGSWATSAPILRRTFRNWYVPTYRQGFLGVRLAE